MASKTKQSKKNRTDKAFTDLLASAGYEVDANALPSQRTPKEIAWSLFLERCSQSQRIRREREAALRTKVKESLHRIPPTLTLRKVLASAAAEGNWAVVKRLLP
jgi:hypothetical protein